MCMGIIYISFLLCESLDPVFAWLSTGSLVLYLFYVLFVWIGLTLLGWWVCMNILKKQIDVPKTKGGKVNLEREH